MTIPGLCPNPSAPFGENLVRLMEIDDSWVRAYDQARSYYMRSGLFYEPIISLCQLCLMPHEGDCQPEDLAEAIKLKGEMK